MIAITACEKQTSDDWATNSTVAGQTPELKKVMIENGYLVFESLQHYETVLQQVIAMSATERLSWEKSIGFASYNSLYLAATEAYSQAATLAATEAVLSANKDIMQLDEEQLPSPTLDYGALELVFNRQGIVKVGNELKQFTADDKQILVRGTLDDLAAARAAGRTNVAAQVYVLDVQRMSKDMRNALQCEAWMGGYSDCNNRKKLRGRIEALVEASSYGAPWGKLNLTTHVTLTANSWYQKNLSGTNKWADYDTNMSTDGMFWVGNMNGSLCIPVTTFSYTLPYYENHIALYWSSNTFVGNAAGESSLGSDTNIHFQLRNLTAFSCNGATHQANETLNCNLSY